MGLREQAASDLQIILQDVVGGFGRAVHVEDPQGNTGELTGFTTDVFTGIDPETGVQVSARFASVALSMAELEAKGFAMPRGVSSEHARPWIVAFDDMAGTTHTFKVSEAFPDRALGMITARLEFYRRS